jgi:hypothetical protein
VPGVNDAELARLRPTDGARYLLVLDRADASAGAAHYGAWIITPSETFAYTATLSPTADPQLAPVGTAAPAALSDFLARLATLTSRQSPWPQRITRWRGPRA